MALWERGAAHKPGTTRKWFQDQRWAIRVATPSVGTINNGKGKGTTEGSDSSDSDADDW